MSDQITEPTIETPSGPGHKGGEDDVKLTDPLIVVLAELVKIILEEDGRATTPAP